MFLITVRSARPWHERCCQLLHGSKRSFELHTIVFVSIAADNYTSSARHVHLVTEGSIGIPELIKLVCVFVLITAHFIILGLVRIEHERRSAKVSLNVSFAEARNPVKLTCGSRMRRARIRWRSTRPRPTGPSRLLCPRSRLRFLTLRGISQTGPIGGS